MAAGAALNINLLAFTDPLSQDWAHWRSQFQSMVTLRNMNDGQARLALRQLVQAEAFAAVADIQPGEAGLTLDGMLTRYQNRFISAAAGDMARADLQSATQRPAESVLAFHARIRSLYNRAFPNAQAQPAILIQCFVKGLINQQVREAVRRDQPQDYNAALNAAQAEMAIINLRFADAVQQQAQHAALQQMAQALPPAPLFGSGHEPMELGAMAKAPAAKGAMLPDGKACYFCGSREHLRNACQLWAKARQELAPYQGQQQQQQQPQQQQQYQPAQRGFRGQRPARGGGRGQQRGGFFRGQRNRAGFRPDNRTINAIITDLQSINNPEENNPNEPDQEHPENPENHDTNEDF
jgi:hypothetical protein